jgi:hypothetical protein
VKGPVQVTRAINQKKSFGRHRNFDHVAILPAPGQGHWFYNAVMRASLLLPLFLAGLSLCQAQTTAPSTAPAGVSRPVPVTTVVEKRTERIRIEDAGSSIDELRVGGETRSITVQPKGDMPSYQVQPGSGQRSWKIAVF